MHKSINKWHFFWFCIHSWTSVVQITVSFVHSATYIVHQFTPFSPNQDLINLDEPGIWFQGSKRSTKQNLRSPRIIWGFFFSLLKFYINDFSLHLFDHHVGPHSSVSLTVEVIAWNKLLWRRLIHWYGLIPPIFIWHHCLFIVISCGFISRGSKIVKRRRQILSCQTQARLFS